MYVISSNGKGQDDRTPVRKAEDAATGGICNSGVPCKQLVDDDGGDEQRNSIPLILRAGSMNKPMIICQFDDENLHFDGTIAASSSFPSSYEPYLEEDT
jgi:hypothetical protein